LSRGIVHSSPSAPSRSSSKSGSSTGCSRTSSKRDDKHCSSSAYCGSAAVIVLKTDTHHRTTKSLSKESKPKQAYIVLVLDQGTSILQTVKV
jgi:hypothetical protein